MYILLTVIVYFLLLLIVSKLTTPKHESSNSSFFVANKQSPWYMVSFGMIGASVSGVSLVSVPGMAVNLNMTYLQMCLGFILGYFAVAYILLPIYYKLNLISIYGYLKIRFGVSAYKTGSYFFLLSKMIGAAIRFYVVCIILQKFVFDLFSIPFFVTVPFMVILIWLYTRNGGVRTLVWTDALQTFFLLLAIILIFLQLSNHLGLNFGETITLIYNNPHSHIFVFDDWLSKQNFWKQFISGAFVVIVMTGLDQDMMQKNLTCRNLKEAQKNMCTYGFFFVPTNLILLCIGVLIIVFAQTVNMTLPSNTDDILPVIASSGVLGNYILVFFIIGIVAACFSSADSALTAITTCYCVDIKEKADDERLRKKTHLLVSILFVLFILAFKSLNNTYIIDAIYTLCSYTYGPLLGLFTFGLFTKRKANDKIVPYIAIMSPIICYMIDYFSFQYLEYKFGYELLLLNGMLTYIGLYLSSCKANTKFFKKDSQQQNEKLNLD